MHAQLGGSVPFSHPVQKLAELNVKLGGEKTLEAWQCTLGRKISDVGKDKIINHTCRRSSKSRAASFFISDTFSFVANLRIVPRLNASIFLYLIS